VRIRARATYHPGATRTVGAAPKAVALADAGEFVEKLRRQLSKKQVAVSGGAGAKISPGLAFTFSRAEESRAEEEAFMQRGPVSADAIRLANENESLRTQLAEERARRSDAEARLAKVRDNLRPQYDALRNLFEQVGLGATANGAVNRAAYEPWLAKAGKAGCRRLLETLIDRPELTKPQLGTLSSCSHRSSTFRGYLAWLKRNGLIEVDGDVVKLQVV
jgi:hypothetical protein